MLYILKSDKTYTIKPESGYGNGSGIQFKRGLFLFDTENTKENYYIRKDSNRIEIDSDLFNIKENLIFNNKIQAEIVFMKMKIVEMQNNGFNFFMPTTFEKFKNEYDQLIQKYPEYAI